MIIVFSSCLEEQRPSCLYLVVIRLELFQANGKHAISEIKRTIRKGGGGKTVSIVTFLKLYIGNLKSVLFT